MSQQKQNVTYSAEISIPHLRAAVTGRVITPDDGDYDQARTVFYGGIDRRPLAIVRVANANDVPYVVSLAPETGIELAVRRGGHSGPGHSLSEPGIVPPLPPITPLPIVPAAPPPCAPTS